jgi:hypothetical protein
MKTQILSILMILLIASGQSFADGPKVGKLSMKNDQSASAKKWSSLFLEAEYSYTRHLGEYGNIWGNSQSGTVSFGKKYNEHYMLYFKTGYSQTADWEDGKEGNSMIPLLIGGKYYFDLGTFTPYFNFSNGVNVISQKYDNFGSQTDDMLVKYAWQLGTGAYVFFTKTFALNATVSYNSSFYYIDAQMTGFVYTGGLTYFFR